MTTSIEQYNCKSFDLLAQRLGGLPYIFNSPDVYFRQYGSLYSEDYTEVIGNYFLGEYGNVTKELKTKADGDELFMSYVLTVKDVFEFELTFYADTNASLTVADVEKQLNEKAEIFSQLSAQSIIDKFDEEFPHAAFDKQALSEKLAAGEKAEITVAGKDVSAENLIIVGNHNFNIDERYLESWQFWAVNSSENGKVIIDGGAEYKTANPSDAVTVGEYLEKTNIISIYVDDADENDLTLYVYAYDFVG